MKKTIIQIIYILLFLGAIYFIQNQQKRLEYPVLEEVPIENVSKNK